MRTNIFCVGFPLDRKSSGGLRVQSGLYDFVLGLDLSGARGGRGGGAPGCRVFFLRQIGRPTAVTPEGTRFRLDIPVVIDDGNRAGLASPLPASMHDGTDRI